MRFSRSLAFFSALLLSTAYGCGGDDPAGADDDPGAGSSSSSSGEVSSSSSGGASSSTSSGGSSSGSAEEVCTATFLWWQKDAYKETGGRTTDVWPPHTTTQLQVDCPSGPLGAPFQGNHGSEPGQLDAEGRPLLDEVRRDTLTATRGQLEALLATYTDCVCEPTTTFLSMDSLDQSLVPDLLEEFIGFVEESGLECGVGGAETQSFVTALEEQNFEAALIIAPSCDWSGGNAESGLDEALRQVLASTSETLADYHVCNNDAKLQAELFHALKTAGAVTACNRAGAVCQAPLWFYSPNDEP